MKILTAIGARGILIVLRSVRARGFFVNSVQSNTPVSVLRPVRRSQQSNRNGLPLLSG
jgi:hypothetical protein